MKLPDGTELDVEACVRLLIFDEKRPPAANSEPSDTQRLDALEAILGNLDAKTEVFLAGLGTTGTARAFQCEIAPATSEGSMAWRSYQGSALRAAIDAAVASTPTEGDPNHE